MPKEPTGPPDEFEQYVRLRYADLRRIAFLLTADWHSADDLVQTALIRCERRWSRITAPDQHAYVRAALVNLSSTFLSRRRQHLPLTDLHGAIAPASSPDDRLTVLSALRALPLGQRQVVVLRYWEGLSEAEIAQALGISAGTVKSRSSRALSSLRGSDLRDLVDERISG